MPRVTYDQTNFTAGEISPKVLGRVDVEKYANAAKDMTNCHPTLHGAARRRDGSLFSQPTKIAAKKARLVPFIADRDHAYMTEFGDSYVRIFGPSGFYLAVELPSLYTESMLPDIDYVQGADTMFVFHPTVPPHRLRRFTDTIWDLAPAPFTVLPFDEQGHALAASLTLSATTGAITATASVPVFLESDVGRDLAAIGAAGIGIITGYTSTTVVSVTVATAFAGLAIPSGSWYLDVSPQGFAISSAKDPVGSGVTITGAVGRAGAATLSAKTGAGITITSSPGVFLAGDVGKSFYADSGIATITAFGGAGSITATVTTDFASLTYAIGGWGITGNVFRAVDVGKYMRMNGGMVKVTAFASASSITATIAQAMSSLVAVPPFAWTLEAPMWSATNGYPRTGTLHEQRLWCGGSIKYPQTVWGSRTALYLDFTKGSSDSDACIFTIASDEINPISYLAAARNLLLHTYGGEFSMQGGIERPITPSNVQVKPHTPHGSKGVRPVTVGNESIYVQRAGLKVRGMSYDAMRDRYLSPDLTILAEHITASGIVSMSYQQEPNQLLWLVLGDGTLVSCTLDRDQNVNGWAKHYTDGAVESVASIPIGSYEQTWIIVRRTINGATVRYVEYLDHTFMPIYGASVSTAYPPQAKPLTYGTTVDCGIVFDSAAGQSVFAVPHLVGKTVTAIADGSPMGNFLVGADTLVTLPRTSKRTLIGIPFIPSVTLLTPEVAGQVGSAQGNYMRCNEMALRFRNTLGATVTDGNGDSVQNLSFRHFGTGVLDQPPTPFTGIKYTETLGWDRGRCEFTISQPQPLPWEVLSVIRTFTVNS